MSFWHIMFGFRGRVRRLTYFGFGLLAFVLLAVPVAVGLMLAGEGEDVIGNLLIVVGLVIGGWSGLALMVKRLHDFGASGWWALAVYATYALPELTNTPALKLILSLIGLVVALVILFKRGTEGMNRFGPQPIGGGQFAVASTT